MEVLVIGHERSTTCQIVVAQPLRRLESIGICEVQIRLPSEVTMQDLAQFDIIIFVRSVDPEAYQRLKWAKRFGKKTVYVIDDQFLAIQSHSKIGRYYRKKRHRETFIRFLREADIVKAESLRLMEWVYASYNRNVVFFPGSINFALLDQLSPPSREEGVIVIGYEGAKKEKSFEPVVPALHQIAAVYGKQVRFEFFGYLPDAFNLRDANVIYEGHDDHYLRFMRRLYKAGWDIGLAPMEDSLFHSYKTNVKFRDYAACQIAGIYSDSPVYHDVIDRNTGLIAESTPDSWFQAIAELIENSDLRMKITESAYALARNQYDLEQCAEQWQRQIINSS